MKLKEMKRKIKYPLVGKFSSTFGKGKIIVRREGEGDIFLM